MRLRVAVVVATSFAAAAATMVTVASSFAAALDHWDSSSALCTDRVSRGQIHLLVQRMLLLGQQAPDCKYL